MLLQHVYFPCCHNKFKKACTHGNRLNKTNSTASPRTFSSSTVFWFACFTFECLLVKNTMTLAQFGATAFMLKFQFCPPWLCTMSANVNTVENSQITFQEYYENSLTLWSSGKLLGVPSGGWTKLSELPVCLTTHRWSHRATSVYTAYRVIFKVRACGYGA